MIKKPEGRNEPDWASKIHIASSPCYYHNYQLGELLASQLNHYITFNILKAKDVNNQSFANRKEVGEYLKTKVFAPGMRYRWDIMIEKATGEKLTPKYYAEQFVN
jgi:peptidyl-dipeptidase A